MRGQTPPWSNGSILTPPWPHLWARQTQLALVTGGSYELYPDETQPQSLAARSEFQFRQRCSPTTGATSPAALQAAPTPILAQQPGWASLMATAIWQGEQPLRLRLQILWQSRSGRWGTPRSRAEVRQREQKSGMALMCRSLMSSKLKSRVCIQAAPGNPPSSSAKPGKREHQADGACLFQQLLLAGQEAQKPQIPSCRTTGPWHQKGQEPGASGLQFGGRSSA